MWAAIDRAALSLRGLKPRGANQCSAWLADPGWSGGDQFDEEFPQGLGEIRAFQIEVANEKLWSKNSIASADAGLGFGALIDRALMGCLRPGKAFCVL